MNMKPIDEMEVKQVENEIRQRIGSHWSFGSPGILAVLRAHSIGDENLTPPEPDWRRWRNYRYENPVDGSKVEFVAHGLKVTGIYCAWRSQPFITQNRSYYNGVTEWRYLEPPMEWTPFDAESDEAMDAISPGWYWLKLTGGAVYCDEWITELGFNASSHDDIVAFCPVQPPPDWKGEER